MRFKAFAIVAVLAITASMVVARDYDVQPNGKYRASTNTAQRFVTQETVKDTLINVAVTDSTTEISMTGVQSAILQTVVFIEEGDDTDTIEVNVIPTFDQGTTYADPIPIDTLLVTSGDAATVYYYTDLLGAAVDANLGYALEQAPGFRLRFDSIGLHAQDTLHVTPYVFKTWEKESPR